MKADRHPNPAVNVRRPRNAERVTLNPPGFVFRPVPGVEHYRIELARSRDFSARPVVRGEVGPWTVWIPQQPLAPGRWYWRWSGGGRTSDVWWFDVAEEALVQQIIPKADLTSRVRPHPRLLLTEQALAALRDSPPEIVREDLATLRRLAEQILAEPHEMPEPPWLPSRSKDQEGYLRLWRAALIDSRAFARGAECLALAWLIWRERRFADAAICRLLSLAKWDPDGSTSIEHNDEPHMSVIQHVPFAYDWLSEVLTGEQRDRIRDNLAGRLRNTYRHLRERLNFLVEDATGSHAGRMFGFLGRGALALLGEVDEAVDWLDYVLRLSVAAWPAWGGADGGWAQGIPYSSFYVCRACEWAYSLYTALGFNLYAKSFFRNHVRWRALCLPVYAEQSPFGDAAERPPAHLPEHYACLEHLRRMFRIASLEDLTQALRQRVRSVDPDFFLPLLLVCDPPEGLPEQSDVPGEAAFTDVGWVAMRRELFRPDQDVALLFKSSQYGSVSHSHADQNAFVLHAFGKTLAIASGYYDAYGTLHHHCWTRQTKAVNAITLAGTGQPPGDADAVGRISRFRSTRRYVCACGQAAAAYAGRLLRADRHVVFADRRYFVILDDLESRLTESFWWHLHSYTEMEFDRETKQVIIDRDGVRLFVQLVYPDQMHFSQSDRFDIPPLPRYGADEDASRQQGRLAGRWRSFSLRSSLKIDYRPQWHFVATPVALRRNDVIAAVLLPLRPDEPLPSVELFEEDGCFGVSLRWNAGAWPRNFAGRCDTWVFARPSSATLRWRGFEAEGLFAWLRQDKPAGLWKRPR